ncbi:MAG TPA: hypothetical protein VHD32_14400 [Candidatus Didemnitutus sp.]|nr:hypothetical protein [Candidatus Didemnitutus sp.]
MGFDPQNAEQPLVNPHKRTTQVNIVIAIAVVVFFAITAVYLVHKARHPGPDSGEHPHPTGAP